MKCTKCNGYGYIDNLEGDGLKCPKCNGTGEAGLTNEEWFCQLSTKEKAKVLSNATYSSVLNSGILVLGKEAERKKWELWLKEKHE